MPHLYIPGANSKYDEEERSSHSTASQSIMIVNTELHSAIRPNGLGRWFTGLFSPALRRNAAVFVILFALTIILQIASGAYRSEFSSYPDEPAHYVTSLMVREYLKAPDLLHPMAFAENYYAHYPKVAFGHWPPVFYIVQSVWMLLFSASRASVRLEIAFTTALLAFSLYSQIKHYFSLTAARLGAVLLICLPLVQSCTDQEMSETLLTLFCFWSAVYLARYLVSARWKDSLWFGVFISLAVLTKGNGWLLCLLPPVALLLTRKLPLLLRPTFWISAAVVAVLCLPWQLMTMELASQGWEGSAPTVQYTLSALGQFTIIIMQITGPALSVLIVIGIIAQILMPLLRRESVMPFPAVMVALIFATWLFHSLVPAGVEDRKMVIAAPALVFFLIAGGFWLADRLPLPLKWRRATVTIAAGVVFAAGTFAIPKDQPYGYTEAALFLTSRPEFQGSTILSSSNSVGEGLLVSEIAMREPRPRDTIIRATKALAQMNWNGSVYHSLVRTPRDVLATLDRDRVNLVVVDTWPLDNELPHNKLLLETIRLKPARFQLLKVCSPEAVANAGQIRIYRFLLE